MHPVITMGGRQQKTHFLGRILTNLQDHTQKARHATASQGERLEGIMAKWEMLEIANQVIQKVGTAVISPKNVCHFTNLN